MATTHTYDVIEDTQINSAFPDTTFESLDTFIVGVTNFEDSGGSGTEILRSVMEFDISDIIADPMPVINWAKVRIHTDTKSTVAGLGAKVRRVKKKPLDFEFVTWLEYGVDEFDPYQNGLDWTNPGGDLATNFQASWTLPTGGGSGWVEIIITDIVKNALTAQSGIVRIGFLRDDETSVGWADFDSKQASSANNRPELKVNIGAGGA